MNYLCLDKGTEGKHNGNYFYRKKTKQFHDVNDSHK